MEIKKEIPGEITKNLSGNEEMSPIASYEFQVK